MKKTLLVACLLSGMAGPAMAQVDLDVLDADMAGPRTQVLVLGSFHLAEHPGEFEPESLAPLLDRLAAFAPQVITIESVSGEQCDMVMRHPGVYSVEMWKGRLCADTGPAQAATGLDVPAAIGRMHELLRRWPEAPEPSQRRELASVYLAAGEPTSALAQWLQLDEGERRAGDGLDDALVAMLDERMQHIDEGSLIAARLAARLGLERVHATDDHTGDDGHVDDVQAYGAAIQRAWDTRADQVAQATKAGMPAFRAGDMLAAYRRINAPELLQVQVQADFGSALADPSPERYGRFYVGGWETRNLRMVANVREAFRDRPDARVLSIVGATHKPWFDSLLGQMQGVDIVDVQDVLE
ncbi:MAG: DUF5694 domain-containing protein [Luteimonas sp.]